MNNDKLLPQTVDQYIAGFAPEIQGKLQMVRSAILKAVPAAEEKIAYQMPAYTFHGVLVYFAGYAKHIGFYPTASGVKMYETMNLKYKFSKGAIQFSLSEEIPLNLITEITEMRAAENMKKPYTKSTKRE